MEEDPSYSESWDSETSDSDEEEDQPLKKPTRRSGRQKKVTPKKIGNSGKEHVSAKNDKEHVSAKTDRRVDRTIGPPCKCGCLEGIGEETVKKIFEEFWAMEGYHKQNAHLGTRLILVDDPSPESQQGVNEPNAIPLIKAVIYTVFYNNIVYKVCRRAFYSIHSIGEKRVRNIINNLKKRGVETDLRKKPNKLTQNFVRMRRRIVQHILKATNGELPSVTEAGSSRFSIRSIYDSYLQSVDVYPKYQVSYTYYCEVFYDLLKKGQTGDEINTANDAPSQHHWEDGETSEDSTSSNDAPTSNVPTPKTSAKETVSTPIVVAAASNQEKTKDYIYKGNSSSPIANPRLILPKLSLILVPCAPGVTKETQSESEELPKDSESEEPHKASDSHEPPDISDSQGPPNDSVSQVLLNVSESQGSPSVSESQPVVQNAAKQEHGVDNLTDVLPVVTSTPPHHNAPIKNYPAASESMKLSEIKEELLDFPDMFNDQDIPTEDGNLSSVHHRPLITKENLKTRGNDPLQLQCFDSNDVTEIVTENSQPCGTDTSEKKKVKDTRNNRKGTDTLNKRKETDIPNKRKRKRNKSLDESDEHTGSHETSEKARMEESSCDTFGKFIALQLRQLPLKNALNLQMEIHNLIAKERLKVLQEEMKKPVKAVNKKPRNDSSRQKSSTKKAAKDKISYREDPMVKTTTVNEESNTKLKLVRQAASFTKHSKDCIQKEVPQKRSRYSGFQEEQTPVTTSIVLNKGSPYQGIPLTKAIVNPGIRAQGSSVQSSPVITAAIVTQPVQSSPVITAAVVTQPVQSSPVITAAIVTQPNEIYTFGKPFGNESLLNIPLTKSEDYHDDFTSWDVPSPISVKSEAESISSL